MKNSDLNTLITYDKNECVYKYLTCDEAAKNGDLECLKYLQENG